MPENSGYWECYQHKFLLVNVEKQGDRNNKLI